MNNRICLFWDIPISNEF